MERVQLSLDEVQQLAEKVLLAAGLGGDHASAIANIVTLAERDRCPSHGLFRIPGYVKSVRSGKVTPNAVPKLSYAAPGIVRVDAANGFAPVALDMGRPALESRAKEIGIAALSVVRCYHFSALWPDVEALASRGLVALMFTSYMNFVAHPGGRQRVYGTNPMAFGWPRRGHPPLVFDQASSASARGEIMMRQREGKPIPEGWAIDTEGKPTTDPTAALAGAQLTFGGYKGASIALMVELLAGPLLGEVLSFEAKALDNGDGGPASGGVLMIAIDPSLFVGGNAEAQLEHAEKVFELILSESGTRLSSDRRYAARQATSASGIVISQALHSELTQLLSA